MSLRTLVVGVDEEEEALGGKLLMTLFKMMKVT